MRVGPLFKDGVIESIHPVSLISPTAGNVVARQGLLPHKSVIGCGSETVSTT